MTHGYVYTVLRHDEDYRCAADNLTLLDNGWVMLEATTETPIQRRDRGAWTNSVATRICLPPQRVLKVQAS